MLINFDVTYAWMRSYRITYIGGRYGGHKTSLAVYLARKLWQDKFIDSVYTNFRCAWAEPTEDLAEREPKALKSCLIFDEAGVFFETRRDLKGLLAALRKMDLYVLAPSVETPTRRLTKLMIEPRYSFLGVGLPLIVYRTSLRGTYQRDLQKSYFAWLMPQSVYGIYDTEDFPVDAGKMGEGILALVDKLAKHEADKQFARPAPSSAGQYEYQNLLEADLMSEAAEVVEYAHGER